MLHEHSGSIPVFIPPSSSRFPFLSRYFGLISRICLCAGAAVVAGSVLYASWPQWGPQLGFHSRGDDLQAAAVTVSSLESAPIYDLKVFSGAHRAYYLNSLGKVASFSLAADRDTLSDLSPVDLQSTCELMAKAPGEDCLAFSLFNGRVRLHYPEHPDRDVSLRRPRNTPVVALVFSPDGDLIASGDAVGRVQIWSVRTGRRAAPLPRSKSSIDALCFASDDTLMVAIDTQIQFWKLPPDLRGPATLVSATAIGETCRDCFLTPDGRFLILSDYCGNLSCWNCADRQQIWTQRISSSVCRAMTVTRDSKRLIVSRKPNSVEVLDLASGEPLTSFEAETGMVTATFLDEASDQLYVASADGRIRVWSMSGEFILDVISPGRADL